MNISKPFIPLRVHTQELSHTVEISGRKYIFGADGMLTSVISQGQELLASPIRIISTEDGEPAEYDNNYPDNESESFIQSQTDEEAVICGCKQSKRFIIDFCNRVHYDGNIEIDFKLMSKGLTVAEVFGMSDVKPIQFKMDCLWLEIPLRKDLFKLYHMYPNGSVMSGDKTLIEECETSTSGALPSDDINLPFKALLWLGNEDLGIGFFAESNRFWQPESKDKAIEIIHTENELILRLRLLDSHPKSWKGSYEDGANLFKQIDFQFGFHITPVKPFPSNPYIHNAFHVDCGTKIKGNYIDYFKKENRFDLLKERGVTTLILHEKWNKCQNWFELSEFTANQLKYIVDECHKRGIKVLPYFGYEISSLAPVCDNDSKDYFTLIEEGETQAGGWWRVPYQRDYVVCYNSSYSDLFVEGIKKLMDTFNIDGVYLDSTAKPNCCCNIKHGCGWYDEDGVLHGTYQIKSIRRLFRKLHKVVKERGGQINLHSFGFINFTIMPYVDQNWLGENMQFSLMKGQNVDVNLDYFRAEYTGRNIGVPVEFIVYENRPVWNFENALAISLIHGILPRPNHIDYPLSVMSRVWSIMDRFPVEKSLWMPYWKNKVKISNSKIKCSYYKFTDLSGADNLLAFISNISPKAVTGAAVQFAEDVSAARDLYSNAENTDFIFDIGAYECKILFIK